VEEKGQGITGSGRGLPIFQPDGFMNFLLAAPGPSQAFFAIWYRYQTGSLSYLTGVCEYRVISARQD